MIGFLAILGCVAEMPPPPTEGPPVELPTASAEATHLTMIAVGDVMNHLAVQRSANQTREGFDALFTEVREAISAADLAFANLETPVARGGRTQPRVFNAPSALLEALSRAGFDILSAANNHAFDQGPHGLTDTVEAVEQHGMIPVGAGGNCGLATAPRIVVRKGVRTAWFGATDIMNLPLNRGTDDPCVAMLDVERLQVDIARARDYADLIVVSVHWGEEYEFEPTDDQIGAARRLVEAGADLVLGHHSHVVSPIQQIVTHDGRTAWVAYGLGNFISNQSAWYRHGVHDPEHGDPRDGLMLEVAIEHVPGRTQITRVRPVALWAENTTVVGRRASETPTIRVVPVEQRLATLEEELAQEQLAGRANDAAPTLARQLRQQIELLRDRQQIVAERTTVRRHRHPATIRGASASRPVSPVARTR